MFFPKFPSTKLQDVNLDWLLKKIRALRGGTTNQVLAKASDADFDFKWVTGGGGGGTSDYNDLVNQPKINNVTLIGNLSGDDLGLLGSEALNDYRTAAAQDAIDAGKQAKIAASGLLKGDGAGGVTAATAGSDYLAPAALMPYRTAAAQDAIDATKQAKIAASGLLKGDGDGGVTAAIAGTDYETPAGAKALGLTGASASDLVRVNAVDANGRPTSWKHVPLSDIVTNQNLLDNWGFTNPVNQRGQATWSNAGEYTVDRWKLTSGTASLGASGLALNGTLVQIRETAIGMPVICSALLSDGSMITPTYDDSTKTYTITATGQTIKAAKLELGAEQTLAHLENGVWVLNEIPNYEDQLLKCQTSKADSTDTFANGTVSALRIDGTIAFEANCPDNGESYVIKYGQLVNLNISTDNLSVAKGNWHKIATLPVGYRPAQYGSYIANDYAHDAIAYISVKTDGDIRVNLPQATTRYRANIIFFTN